MGPGLRVRPHRRRAAVALVLALLAVAAGCGSSDPAVGADRDDDITVGGGTDRPTDLGAARRRAVEVATGGCGAADPTRGSGLALADDLVLTAAHVVSSGGPIEVVTDDGGRAAELVAYDPSRDLALVRPSPPLADVPAPPTSGEVREDDVGTFVATATSGDVPAVVAEVLIIEMDDVRSTTRSTRRAYLTRATTAAGDSGAGLYDGDGRLVGLLFAVSTTDENRSWVTAASEIDAFLADDDARGRFTCDPDRSRVTREP